jgi:hypothetical protein
MRKRVAIPVVVLIWLFIGAIAAAQRGYYSQSDPDCSSVATTLVNILAGPLNYVGLDPHVRCPGVPEPSE